jgi:hypothetical protein
MHELAGEQSYLVLDLPPLFDSIDLLSSSQAPPSDSLIFSFPSVEVILSSCHRNLVLVMATYSDDPAPSTFKEILGSYTGPGMLMLSSAKGRKFLSYFVFVRSLTITELIATWLQDPLLPVRDFDKFRHRAVSASEISFHCITNW